MKLREFDPARHLDSGEAISMYLEKIMERDPDMLASALGDVARAKGMSQLANETGLKRESLYQSLSENGNPTYQTLLKVMNALGVRFSVRPLKDQTVEV